MANVGIIFELMLLQSQSKRAGHSRAVEPDDQLSDVSKALTSES